MVPLALQGESQMIGKGRLDMHGGAANPLPARCVERGLGVEVEVNAIHQDLHMPLRLHKAAHHPKGTYRLIFAR